MTFPNEEQRESIKALVPEDMHLYIENAYAMHEPALSLCFDINFQILQLIPMIEIESVADPMMPVNVTVSTMLDQLATALTSKANEITAWVESHAHL